MIFDLSIKLIIIRRQKKKDIPKGIKSDETCIGFFNTNTKIYVESFECPNYCCGLCSSKYCCANEKSRIEDQENCLERCYKYNNGTDEIDKQYCYDKGEFCCGNCNNRYCCSSSEEFLNQYSCKNNSPTSSSK